MRIFIDDERFSPDDGENWIICRSMEQFQVWILASNIPTFISFDHDLGDNVPTGMDIAKWLIEYDLDHDILPMDFSWYVHSQNVNGRDNINGLLANYSKVTGKFVCTPENIRYIINNT